MSALGHVWTAPWQGLSDVAEALVGCGQSPREEFKRIRTQLHARSLIDINGE
jgi:hypothetical protein